MSDRQLERNSPPDQRNGEMPAADKNRVPKETPDQFRARSNLKLLSEVYRNHWEVFLKGFALYLASCSALIGIAAYNETNKPLALFVGAAILIGSILSLFGVYTAYHYIKEMKLKVDNLCKILGYHSFISNRPVHITIILSFISLSVLASGVLFILFSLGMVDMGRFL